MAAMKKVVQQAAPAIILMGQTIVGRDLAPWLAFSLNTGATMDCVALEIDPSTKRMRMTRPVYGGNAQAVQVCDIDPQIATVRNKAMTPLAKDENRKGEIVNVAAVLMQAQLKLKQLIARLKNLRVSSWKKPEWLWPVDGVSAV